MRNQRRQNLNTHLNSQSAAAVQLQGTQMQQLQQQQQQQRSSETSLAIALMGIVIMHIGIDLLVTFFYENYAVAKKCVIQHKYVIRCFEHFVS